MRVSIRICAALLAAGLSFPAQATVYLNVGIYGSLAGSTTTNMCNSGSPVSCFSDYPGGIVTAPYNQSFSVALGMMPLQEGDNAFSYGYEYSIGSFSGVINNAGGVLTGHDLQYSRTDTSCHSGAVGCEWVFASAPTFSVTGGVPEPATWILMLLGFGMIGAMLRRDRGQSRRRLGIPTSS